jgi:hypothetical protein
LRAGVPVVKIDDFRDLFEEYAPFTLTASSHMSTYIPSIAAGIDSQTKSMVEDKYSVLLFDGTPHIGEVIAIVIRLFYNKKVRQRLLEFKHLDKSPTAAEVYSVRFSFIVYSFFNLNLD